MIQSLFSLEGKVAVISGGSGAIGRGAAKILESLGARIVLTGHTKEHLLSARESLPAHADVSVLLGDARDQGHVNEILELGESLGGVDILVNCIGTQRRRPLIDATAEDLEYL